MTMTPQTGDRSLSDLVSELFSRLSTLIRGEVALAQAEVAAKVRGAAIGVGLIAGAALVVIAALVLLLVALAAALSNAGLSEPLSDLISAIVGFLVSGLLVFSGIRLLRADTLAPKRTLVQLQKDVATTKEHLS